MDSDGIVVDNSRKPIDASAEEVLTWYKNMLTGTAPIRDNVRAKCSAERTMSG